MATTGSWEVGLFTKVARRWVTDWLRKGQLHDNVGWVADQRRRKLVARQCGSGYRVAKEGVGFSKKKENDLRI